VPLFYNYGFAFFRWAGPFYSILIGLGILVVQAVAAHLWLGRFVYGPLEWLWRSLTFLNFSTPMRKRREARETGIQAGPPQLAMP
jgi:uncharacterized protein